MVEQDAVAAKQVVRLTVIDDDPIAVHFGYPVRTPGIERRFLILRKRQGFSEELACRGLVEPGLHSCFPDSVQKPQCPDGVDLGGIFRDVE